MVLYLYSLSLGVFMTATFRIPAPLLFSFPLLFLFREKSDSLLYRKELWSFSIAFFFYYLIGIGDFRAFAANLIVVILCSFYFNYFISSNRVRFNFSVLIFYALLAISSVIMVLDHFFPEIKSVRELIIDDKVLQSPSGLASTQFTFGYQLAAFGPFVLIYTFLFHKPVLIKVLVFVSCLIFIYLGMQRSVLITFVISLTLFLLIYFRLKAVFFLVIAVFIGALFFNYVVEHDKNRPDNIFTKNENNDSDYNRSLLTSENLKIYSDYPLGLIFYGKNWNDVIYRNRVFSSGVTSHNAYLMFITYLGPFLGLSLLLIIYSRVIRIGYNALKEIRLKENALLICLCFSFLGVSINAFAHNAWLLSADGPTLFLYFSILHLSKMQLKQAQYSAV